MKVIFNGLEGHPCNGLICTLGWKFETSDCWIIYFENDPRGIGMEIAEMHELTEVI